MKTCPACHHPVPDTATICPHEGCGHALPVAHTGVKRPPPPPTRVHVVGNDAHPATPRPAAPQPAVVVGSSRRRMLVWVAALLVGSGAVAAGLLTYFPWPPDTTTASVDVAAEAAAPTSDKTAPSKSGDDKTKPLQQPRKASQKDGDAASTEPAPNAKTSPATTDDPLGIIADEQKKMVDQKPTGLPADAPPKPTPLDVPQQPEVAIVADTPKELYAARTKAKTPEWLGQRGGTVEAQKAVDDGLNWLARHQGQDGHWGADCLGGTDPNSRCDPNAPCQGPGSAYEIAQTGLALLAFQAGGHYYFNGQKYSSQVTHGLDYLVQEQAPDGSIVGSQNPTPEQINAGRPFHTHFMYEHAIGTFALCEACAVALAEGKKPDPRYLKAAKNAVHFIEKVQHDDGGWRYTTKPGDQSDCSVSGWVMLALKTAREAKVDVLPRTISRMMSFFAEKYANGRTGYVFAGSGTDATTGVGMMEVEFFEHNLHSPVVQNGATLLAQSAGMANPVFNSYLWYNCTMAMFQAGGEPWKRWNGAVRDRVVSFQVQGEGCDRGSWPPAADFYGGIGGRVYTTALSVLTLEVYYRFQRVAGQPDQEKFFGK